MLGALMHIKSTFFPLYLSWVFMCSHWLYIWLLLLVVLLFYKFIYFKSHYWLHTYFKLRFLGDSFIIIMSFTFNRAIDIFVMYSNSLSLWILCFIVFCGQYLSRVPIILPLYLLIISSCISVFFFFAPVLFCLMQTLSLLSFRHPLCWNSSQNFLIIIRTSLYFRGQPKWNKTCAGSSNAYNLLGVMAGVRDSTVNNKIKEA